MRAERAVEEPRATPGPSASGEGEAPAAQGRAPLTVCILTRDEEALIARAVGNAGFADEVLVLDSGSTDRTCEIAADAGAVVRHQDWLGWLGQHEKATELASNDWVMKLDADEIVSDTLRRSICDALAGGPDPATGFVVDRVDEFMGEVMPNARRKSKRDAFVRVFNRTRSRWDPQLHIHEQVEVAGERHRLDGVLLHWRNSPLQRMVATYNSNTDVEARALSKRNGPLTLAMLLVLKPVARFGWSYVVCSGWRHGMRGFIRAVLASFADFLAHAKAWEQENAPPKPDPTPAQMRGTG